MKLITLPTESMDLLVLAEFLVSLVFQHNVTAEQTLPSWHNASEIGRLGLLQLVQFVRLTEMWLQHLDLATT